MEGLDAIIVDLNDRVNVIGEVQVVPILMEMLLLALLVEPMMWL